MKKMIIKNKINHKKLDKSDQNIKLDIKPLGSRVLIKPFSKEELEVTKNSFGIILPESDNKDKSDQGLVVAVGDGYTTEDGKNFSFQVKVGDRVAFSKYGYEDIKIDEEEYYLIKEENILAIIN